MKVFPPQKNKLDQLYQLVAIYNLHVFNRLNISKIFYSGKNVESIKKLDYVKHT